MGTVLYEASPLQAFLTPLGVTLFFVVLGAFAIGAAILRPNQRPASRVVSGLAGVFLIIVGCVLAGVTLFSFTSGARTVVLRLDNKSIVNDSCGENGETCTRYVLSSTTNTDAYDFDVPQGVYQSVKLQGCYQFTYYPQRGLFGLGSNTSSYQHIDNITRIAVADPTACQ